MEDNASDFWSVWLAAERWLGGVSPSLLHGMTGGALRSRRVPLLRSDMSHGLIPGLAMCGVQAELLSLPDEEEARLHWLRESLRRHIPIPVFAFAAPRLSSNFSLDASSSTTLYALRSPESLRRGFPAPQRASRVSFSAGGPLEEDDFQHRDAPEEVETPADDPLVTQQALVIALNRTKSLITVQQQEGNEYAISVADMPDVYSHGIRLQHMPSRRTRRERIQQAIRAWTLFACAYPERTLGMEAEDAPTRALAGDFWRTLAGKDRSALATRLRRLAQDFETATRPEIISSTLERLYELACVSWNLPPCVEEALLAPYDRVLTQSERRELIYLCRAGVRDLKILAAHRLSCECDYPDVRATLQQLCCDADPLVKKVACN